MASTSSVSALSHLWNPLAISQQLETSASQLDGVSSSLEASIRFEASRLVQAAGILLRLPQEITAQCIVVLQRFWTGPDGGSLVEHDSKNVAAAALYLTAKPSTHPVSARQVLTTVEYLSSVHCGQLSCTDRDSKLAVSWHLSEGQYEAQKQHLYAIEAHMLRVMGFQTHVVLPHPLCVNYLQTLDAFQSAAAGKKLVTAAFAHLNSALLSPQLLYLTHQPSSLATAAIYLAARETDVKLPEVEWWEVFDVDREELGFLVVAFRSFEGFVLSERRNWGTRRVPLTVDELRAEMERRRV